MWHVSPARLHLAGPQSRCRARLSGRTRRSSRRCLPARPQTARCPARHRQRKLSQGCSRQQNIVRTADTCRNDDGWQLATTCAHLQVRISKGTGERQNAADTPRVACTGCGSWSVLGIHACTRAYQTMASIAASGRPIVCQSNIAAHPRSGPAAFWGLGWSAQCACALPPCTHAIRVRRRSSSLLHMPDRGRTVASAARIGGACTTLCRCQRHSVSGTAS